MPITPGKRGRDEEDEHESFFFGLFSTAKKKRRSSAHAVESSTAATAATLPRLNLSSPSSRSSPAAPASSQPAVTFEESVSAATTDAARVPEPAAAPTPVRAPRLPASAAAPKSPWQQAPIRFSPGPMMMTTARRRAQRPYRPQSRTLVTNRRRRQAPTHYDKELAARLLDTSRAVFRPDPNFVASRSAPGQRQFGTNQTGSRLLAAPPRRSSTTTGVFQKKVSFDETTQVAPGTTTPRVSRNGSSTSQQQRRGTPYRRAIEQDDIDEVESPLQDSVMQESFVEEEPREYADDEAPLPVDVGALARPNVSPDAPFVFDGIDKFVDRRPSRGTLVAEFSEPSTLAVTSVPRPKYAPLLFGTGEEQQDSKPATAPTPAKESPDDERKPQKRSKTVDLGWGDTFKPFTENMWICDTCSTSNPVTEHKCMACEAVRGTASSDDKKNAATPAPAAAAGSIGPGGFSFGNAAFAPAPAAGADTTNGTTGGFLFDNIAAPAPAVGGGFSFGAAPTPSETPMPFSFDKTNGSSGFVFNSAAKSIDDVSPKEQSAKKLRFSMESDGGKRETTTAPFSFAPVEETKEQDSKPALFSFGTKPSEEAKPDDEDSQPATGSKSSGFQFGSKPAEEKKSDDDVSKPAATTGFSFGGAKPNESEDDATKTPQATTEQETKEDTAMEAKADEPKTPSFSFGAKPAAKSEPKPAPAGGFSFGVTPASGDKGNKPASTFVLKEPATEIKAPKVDFSFGTTKTSDSTASHAMGPPPNKPSTFGGTAPATATDSAAPQPFAFGSSASSAPPTATETSTPAVSTAPAPATDESASQSTFFGNLTPAPAPTQDEDRKKKRRPEDEEKSAADATSSVPPLGGSFSPATPSAPAFSFAFTPGPTAVPPATPYNASSVASGDTTTAPPFGSVSAAPAPSGGGFTFGIGSTPVAPPSIPLPGGTTPAQASGFGQNGGSNPFVSTSAAPAPAMEFGSSTTQAAQSTTQPVSFNFGTSSGTQNPPAFGTPTPPSQQGFTFGPAQQPAPTAGVFSTTPAAGGFSFSSAPAPAAMPAGGFGSGGFGQAPAPAAPSGFGVGFGSTTPVVPVGRTPNIPTGGGFSIGSTGGGGGGRSGASTGRRRILRAKRPPGSGR